MIVLESADIRLLLLDHSRHTVTLLCGPAAVSARKVNLSPYAHTLLDQLSNLEYGLIQVDVSQQSNTAEGIQHKT